MRHLIKKISSSKFKIIAQFKRSNNDFKIVSSGKDIKLTINDHDALDLNKNSNYDKISHLIRDIILKGHNNSNIVEAYVCDDSINPIIKDIKDNSSNIQFKIVDQAMEIPRSCPMNIGDVYNYDLLIPKLKNLNNILHDVNETLRVCREDALSITGGKLISTMWGAKPTQDMILEFNNDILSDKEWDRAEFYINMIMKSVQKLIHKMNSDLLKICDEEKKVVSNVLIPNIIQSFDKIRLITSNAVIILSNLIYIDEVFKKNTTYPAVWFINNNMLGDLKLDYQNLINFILMVPKLEKDIIYPLDMIKHKLINERIK